MDKKYKLINETINVNGHTLHRIKALRDFGNVKKGELGGFIESEGNLSQDGLCWVFAEAKVYGDAMVGGNAMVHGNARVYGSARVYGNAMVFDDAMVSGDARVCGNAIVSGDAMVFDHAVIQRDVKVFGHAMVFASARVSDNAEIYGNAKVSGHAGIGKFAHITSPNDYIVIGPLGSRDAYTTVYRVRNTDVHACSSDLRIQCGCFNGTPDEFFATVDKTHKKGTIYHTQYTTIIKFMTDTMCQMTISNGDDEK